MTSDQGLKYVYVIDAKNKVEARRVSVGSLQDNGLRTHHPGVEQRGLGSPRRLATGSAENADPAGQGGHADAGQPGCRCRKKRDRKEKGRARNDRADARIAACSLAFAWRRVKRSAAGGRCGFNSVRGAVGSPPVPVTPTTVARGSVMSMTTAGGNVLGDVAGLIGDLDLEEELAAAVAREGPAMTGRRSSVASDDLPGAVRRVR